MDYANLQARFADVAFTTAVPFTDDTDAIDHDAMTENLTALERAGSRMFIACGNTGEYYSLTDAERIAVVETHVEALSDDAVVVGGVGGSTKSAVSLAEAYAEAGVDAIMTMHPEHTYAHERGLREHYRRIADATDLGVVIYKRGPEVSREVLLDLVDREDVVAVKFAVDDIDEFSASVAAAPDAVAWVNGIAERYAVSFAAEGAVGFTTGIGNAVPEATLALFDAIEAGDWERAREIRDLLRPYEDLRAEAGDDNHISAANNVPAVKYGMDLAGLTGGPVRTPLVELSEVDAARVEEYYGRIREADL